MSREDGHRLADEVAPVASRDDLLAARREVDSVRCDRELAALIVELANRTRTSSDVLQGVSTRGAQALHRACRARAYVHGRDFVVPDDVRELLAPAWAHRLTPRSGADPAALLQETLAGTPLPD